MADSSESADLKAELERHLSLETRAVKEARIQARDRLSLSQHKKRASLLADV